MNINIELVLIEIENILSLKINKLGEKQIEKKQFLFYLDKLLKKMTKTPKTKKIFIEETD